MRKRWFLVGMILLLLPLLTLGGVSQDQYDAVMAQLSGAQQELQSVRAELEAAQAKVSELTSSLENTKAELATASANLENTKGRLTEASIVFSSLELIVEVNISLAENQATWGRYNLKEITSDQFREQTGDQWVQITVA